MGSEMCIRDRSELVRYCFPVVSVAATRIPGWPKFFDTRLRPTSDPALTELITDAAMRRNLMRTAQFGDKSLRDPFSQLLVKPQYEGLDSKVLDGWPQLIEWAETVADALDLSIVEKVMVHEALPTDLRNRAGISLIVGNFLYMNRPGRYATTSESLLSLSTLPDLEKSALGKIYGEDFGEELPFAPVGELRPVSQRQTQIGGRLLTKGVTALSGPPGTGKSHVVVLTALEAVSRGMSVLVAASSPHAVDVLTSYFAEAPGPTPVVFGGSAWSEELADQLSKHSDDSRSGLVEGSTDAIRDHAQLVSEIDLLLRAEKPAVRRLIDPAEVLAADEQLDAAGDLNQVQQRIEEKARGTHFGWIQAVSYTHLTLPTTPYV